MSYKLNCYALLSLQRLLLPLIFPNPRDLPMEITCVLCTTVGTKRFVDGNNCSLRCGCDVCTDCFTSWCVAKVEEMCTVIRCPLGSRAVSSKRACTEPVPQEAVQYALRNMPQHMRKYTMVGDEWNRLCVRVPLQIWCILDCMFL